MTRALVTKIAMEQMFLAKTPDLRSIMQETWQSSLDVAALCEDLAKHYTSLRADQALLAGLIHRIGVLPIVRLIDDQPGMLPAGTPIKRVLDELHADVGSILLKS